MKRIDALTAHSITKAAEKNPVEERALAVIMDRIEKAAEYGHYYIHTAHVGQHNWTTLKSLGYHVDAKFDGYIIRWDDMDSNNTEYIRG